jgi:hypothetical protein
MFLNVKSYVYMTDDKEIENISVLNVKYLGIHRSKKALSQTLISLLKLRKQKIY